MNKFQLKYSPKTIPLPPRNTFIKSLLFQTENFLKRLRWRAYFFDFPDARLGKKETYGFPTDASPPMIKDLVGFESDIYGMLSTLKFRKIKNPTLVDIGKEATRIKTATTSIIPADKTSNFYEVPVSEYNKLVKNAITSDYKKSDDELKKNINNNSAIICQKLKIDDRVEQFQTNPAYILLKDHKSDFQAKKPCRLINPAKSQVGKISKRILEKTIKTLKDSLNLNQWKNTQEVLAWFKKNRTSSSMFLQFDVVNFYPSISEELFKKSLDFAKETTTLTKEEEEILHHARNSLLVSTDGQVWQKKTGIFDVTMGSYDGAEVCEIVGIFLLQKIAEIIPSHQVGLYRDDGLAILDNTNGPQLERYRKKLHNLFQNQGLKITTEPPSQSVNFLDVTLNSKDGSYRPFKKEDLITEYVHRQSNHPPNVIKRIPEIVGRRLSSISSSKEIFENSRPYYESCLRASGYEDCSLEYQETGETKKKRKNRSRNVIWYNPPWNAALETNIGKKFFEIMEKHFPVRHRYRKFINRNMVKLSYSCTENLKSIILKKNRQMVQREEQPPETRTCNCRGGSSNCPLQGNCLQKEVIYEAQLQTTSETYNYVGLTSDSFKKRYNQHLSSFRNERYKASTTLSSKIWALKENNEEFRVKWRILKRARSYRGGGRGKCDLCLTEKEEILKRIRHKNCLNTRNELLGKCRHLKRTRLKSMFMKEELRS